MKPLVLTLDSTLTDTLQYRARAIQILSILEKYADSPELTQPWFVDNAMVIIFPSGMQMVKISIDINDLCRRLFTLAADACWSLDSANRGRGDPNVMCELHDMQKNLEGLLTRHRVYWFEWSQELSEQTIETIVSKKRHMVRLDTVHNCMFVVQILVDLYRYQHYADRYNSDAISAASSRALSPEMLEKVFEMVGWRSMKSSRTPGFSQRLTAVIKDACSESYDLFALMSDDLKLSPQLSYMTDEIFNLQIVREVLILLWVMPPYIGDEIITVTEEL